MNWKLKTKESRSTLCLTVRSLYIPQTQNSYVAFRGSHVHFVASHCVSINISHEL